MPHPLLCVIYGKHESSRAGGQTVCGETGFAVGEPVYWQRDRYKLAIFIAI
jgi:hypothetical protein